jgi:hypothetical protein
VFYHTKAQNRPSYILFRLFVYIYPSPRHTLSYNNSSVFYHTTAQYWPSYILFGLFVYIYPSPRHTLFHNNSSQVLTFCLNSLWNPHLTYTHFSNILPFQLPNGRTFKVNFD